ncbi:MAG: DUF192 domain-containing protein [Microgenomates group bacterium]
MKKFVIIVLLLLLFYTRFVGLDWGLPYPMHPDERNMAVAVQQLNCPSFPSNYHQITNCFNPHFFAYGQFPLYLAYGGIQLSHLILGISAQPTYIEATISLRIISALSSILLIYVLLKIIELMTSNSERKTFSIQVLALIFLIFQPYAIQFSHFGTTESLLMLLYTLIVYYSLRLSSIGGSKHSTKHLFFLALFSGLALGTKTSSFLFLGIPLLIMSWGIFSTIGGIIEGAQKRAEKVRPAGVAAFEHFLGRFNYDGIYHKIISLFLYLLLTSFFFILSSPHSLLNWKDFIGSMNYESAVGLGTYKAFYTRQFENTIPILFQFEKILPYVLGWPQLIVGILGFIFLPWFTKQQVARAKGRPDMRASSPNGKGALTGMRVVTESVVLNQYNLLRFALLLSFLPVSFFYAKWTRFIAPSFPLFSLLAILFLIRFLRKNRVLISIVVFIAILPGIAYVSIYLAPDIRFTASEWIYKNIPAQSKILTETANVIDLPIIPPIYQNIPKNYLISSFNFYDLDVIPQLQSDLSEALKQADYIIIPSRRIFKNHPKNTYPLLADYYEKLFSLSGKYEKIIEFTSYPHIAFLGKNLIELPDENAEETWTVFDHPVTRIYKKKSKLEVVNNLNFSGYDKTSFKLSTTNLRLLVADTPKKWERGLMFVTNKNDIGGLDGMIFNFPDNQMRTFWNKNTLSHLTLYWISKGKVIGISDLPSITKTNTITTVSSPSEADTVIEIIK